MRLTLHPHPDTPCDAIRALKVDVARADAPYNLALNYLIEGDTSRLALPKRASEIRTNELWRHTCFEAFVQAVGEEGYQELNFSPSTAWAAYSFDSYRHGMMDALLVAHWIDTQQTTEFFELSAHVMLPSLPEHARLALSAVIEETNGVKSYWALAHPPGRPDFHHADGFVLELP